MDFSLTEEQQQLREAARRFAAAELPALALELEEKHAPVPQAMMKRYADMGFLGINLPEPPRRRAGAGRIRQDLPRGGVSDFRILLRPHSRDCAFRAGCLEG
jgi:alkylation response protein AidB-like acyl-CoA dehydrogenase